MKVGDTISWDDTTITGDGQRTALIVDFDGTSYKIQTSFTTDHEDGTTSTNHAWQWRTPDQLPGAVVNG